MSAALTLAGPEHLETVLRMVESFHNEAELQTSPEHRQAALEPLLEGNPYGAVYVIGPARAPIGYVALNFSWSIEFGGLEAFVDEIYIRPAVRGRGMGGEVLGKLARMLKEADLSALSLEVDRDNERAHRLYRRARFEARDRYLMMTRKL